MPAPSPSDPAPAPVPALGHVLVTGATGFLGQAILERLLADHPETRVTVLIRPRGTQSAQDRLAGLARKPVFRAQRDRSGHEGVASALAQRVQALDADLSESVPALPEDLTAVIHCASTVSFDPPVDEAFAVNVRGTANLFTALAAVPSRPHVVHVSTAYVSALRKGLVPEQAVEHGADWRTELAHALAAREEAEAASRRPGVLGPLLAQARARHGKVGAAAVAEAAERARAEWASERLVAAGRLRAQSLGWTDVYTLTKALGEAAAVEHASAAGLALSVLRPTIVQCSLERPYPGWFDSYKMMDPMVLAYGRGTLTEFPVHPDGVIDVVPVDYVTSAALAVAQEAPEPARIRYFHVGTGARNPLTQQDLHRLLRAYFESRPMADGARGHIRVSAWNFPGAAKLDRRLREGRRALDLADRLLDRLPANARTRAWADRLDKESERVDMLRRLFDLYGGYGAVDAVYDDGNLARLLAARPHGPGCDVAEISWPHYLTEVYGPSITAVSRRTAGPRRRPATTSALPRDPAVAAVFDLEGTVVASNLIETYLWARLGDRPRADWPREVGALAAALPGLIRTERQDRGEFIRAFMQRYAGASADGLRELVRDRLGDALLRQALPEALRRVRSHRAAGHRTVLITGAADFFVAPLRPLFDEIAATRLREQDGVLTGLLEAPPLIGEARAAWVRDYAEAAGVDLARSYAYGDSVSDRPLLELVGQPVAVNPDLRLYRFARDRSWRIERWSASGVGRMENVLAAVGPARPAGPRPAGASAGRAAR